MSVVFSVDLVMVNNPALVLHWRGSVIYLSEQGFRQRTEAELNGKLEIERFGVRSNSRGHEIEARLLEKVPGLGTWTAPSENLLLSFDHGVGFRRNNKGWATLVDLLGAKTLATLTPDGWCRPGYDEAHEIVIGPHRLLESLYGREWQPARLDSGPRLRPSALAAPRLVGAQ